MAKYKITDPQTGKSVTVSGDHQPTQADAEKIFTDAGLRSNQPTSQKKPLNPVVDFLMGRAIRTAQDIGTTIGQRQSGALESQQGALDMQAKLDAMARNANPEDQRRLQSVSGDITRTVTQNSQDMAGQFSEDVKANPIMRGLNTGADVANTAALVSGALNLASKTPELLQKTGTAAKDAAKLLNPRQLWGEARREAAKVSTAKIDANNIIKAGQEYVRLNPEAAPILEKHLPAIVEATNPQELLKHMEIWKNAYTQAGKVGKAARSGLFNALYRAGTEEMMTNAPEVAKYTHLLRLTYQVPKTILKTIWYGGVGATGASQLKNLLGMK